ncbi:hypothetical protein M758_6G088100 [Ceratodon purpureus]|uniref:Uncharacterized protein n=1 Tax=Ceratodon purpureus TaxID=3225 RepID=A0A8T0HGL8_CERPU|nr:hypothetical protein KC19_6G092200 [Ceratodon purpureus]KAG0613252.1 hypothetical protein M758_6G088100 [Ceratodon purpureus]
MSNIGLRQQLRLEETQLATVPEECEKSPKKNKKVSMGLARLKRSPYLVKQQSPQRERLITYKKEVISNRLPSAYRYFKTVEFRKPSKYDIGSTEDCCFVDNQDDDKSKEPGIDEVQYVMTKYAKNMPTQ